MHLFYKKLSYSDNKNVSDLFVVVEIVFLTLVISYVYESGVFGHMITTYILCVLNFLKLVMLFLNKRIY